MKMCRQPSAAAVAIAALLCTHGPAQGAERRYSAMTDPEREAVVARARELPALDKRIDSVTAPFVGTPYGISPLGEGAGVDPDPRLRWDEVDCLTFVETSIALSLAPSKARLLEVLDDIRYSAPPAEFDRRNHFVEAQWIPNNAAKGYLRSISKEVAGSAATVATTEFSLARWHDRAEHGELELPDAAVPKGRYSLDVVPIAFAEAHPEKIPNGSLLLVVREDFWRDPTRVSHVGFVIEKKGRKVLRHAAKKPYERVVDEPIESFFERNSRYAKRPVIGFALFEIRSPTERISKLGESSSGTAQHSP